MTKRTAAFRKQIKARGYRVPRDMTEAQLLALEQKALAAMIEAEELELASLAWLDVIAAELIEID